VAIDAAVFFKALNDGAVSDSREFREAVSTVNSSFNWFYADSRDIAYQLSGAYPLLTRGTDPNLPIWGTGRYDWRGFDPTHYTSAEEPARSLPGEVNPARGYLISWNNKPARGWRAAHVDAAVMAEAPRLAPHVPAMRAAIAGALGVGEDRINVKATTLEGMGAIGREEGIAAQAVASLEDLPR